MTRAPFRLIGLQNLNLHPDLFFRPTWPLVYECAVVSGEKKAQAFPGEVLIQEKYINTKRV